MHKTRIATAVTAASIAAIVGAGAAISQDQPPPAATPAPPPTPAGDVQGPQSTSRPITQAVEPGAARVFGVLRRAQGPGDAVPAEAARVIGEGDAAFFGANPRLARFAQRTASASLYLVPANGHVCLVSVTAAGSGMTCSSVDQAAAGYLIQTERVGAEGVRVQGVMPDGVEKVKVTGNRDSEGVVQGNAYSVDFSENPGDLTWTGTNGAPHRLAVPDGGA